MISQKELKELALQAEVAEQKVWYIYSCFYLSKFIVNSFECKLIQLELYDNGLRWAFNWTSRAENPACWHLSIE